MSSYIIIYFLSIIKISRAIDQWYGYQNHYREIELFLSEICIILIVIRHISPLMFGVIDDKPEGVAREIYHV